MVLDPPPDYDIIIGRPLLDTSREPTEVIAIIGPAEVTVTAAPIDESPSLLDMSQELVASPSDTRTEEPPWSHTPMQVPLLDQPEPWAGPFLKPLTEPFVGQYEERPHEPTEPDTVDAMSATNDRAEVQDAMDDGTEAEGVMRL